MSMGELLPEAIEKYAQNDVSLDQRLTGPSITHAQVYVFGIMYMHINYLTFGHKSNDRLCKQGLPLTYVVLHIHMQ